VASQYRSSDAAEDRAASASAGEDELRRRREPAPVSVGAGAAAGEGTTPMPKVLTWDKVAEELARTPAPPGPGSG
jgi:hypothetical protein